MFVCFLDKMSILVVGQNVIFNYRSKYFLPFCLSKCCLIRRSRYFICLLVTKWFYINCRSNFMSDTSVRSNLSTTSWHWQVESIKLDFILMSPIYRNSISNTLLLFKILLNQQEYRVHRVLENSFLNVKRETDLDLDFLLP